MDINKMSRKELEELQEQIEERLVETTPPPKPKMIAEIDISVFKNLAEDIIKSYEAGMYDDDTPQWCYETLMEEVYGDDIWEWVNTRI